MQKKFYAYYRVSPNPRKNSPEENQFRAVRSYAEKKKYLIVKEYKDLLISGKEMARPEFNQMLSDIANVDGIIIFDVSRFGRNAKEAIPLFLNILNIGKMIVLVKNNKTLDYSKNSSMSTWEMLVPIIEFFQAEEYIKNLRIRQKIGIQRKIEKTGRWGPKEKKVNWAKYADYSLKGLNKTAISILMGIGRTTLYRRFDELYSEIENLKELGFSEEEISSKLKIDHTAFSVILSDFKKKIGEKKNVVTMNK